MPESYGKRQRSRVKARKAAAKEERRIARNQRAADRAAGVVPVQPPDEPPLDRREDVADAEGGNEDHSEADRDERA